MPELKHLTPKQIHHKLEFQALALSSAQSQYVGVDRPRTHVGIDNKLVQADSLSQVNQAQFAYVPHHLYQFHEFA
ncbi:Uncharacterised protein [Acinetobacter baumannii]|nr:Uncharacterised protein [Acinetobacter baumannii]SSS40995.1 Uncharacterised protein [Acinetobacter baumannii]